MTDELFGTSSVPDEAAYWSALSARVAAAAISDSQSGMAIIARSRWCLPATAAAAIAAAVVGLVAFQGRSGNAATNPEWAAALVSNDAVARSVIAAAAPPPIPLLMMRVPMPGGGVTP